MVNETATGCKPKRLESPDIIKGLVILVIITFHILFQQEKNMTTGNNEQALILQILYTGLMVFFIISGYFFRPGRSYSENVKKRALQLIVLVSACILVFPLILYGWCWVIGQPMDPSAYFQYSLIRLIGPEEIGQPFTLDMEKNAIDVFAGYYFLQCMFVGFLMFYALADKVLNDPKKFILAVFVLLCGAWLVRAIGYNLPFYFGLGCAAAAFMLVGALMGQHKVIEYLEERNVKDKKYWLYILIALVVTVVVGFLFHPGTGFYANSFGTYSNDWGVFQGASIFPYFVLSCSTGYLIIVISTWLCKVPGLSKFLSVIGKHTLAILLLHEFVVKMIAAPFYPLTDNAAFPTMPMPFAICMIFLALGAGLLAAKYAPIILQKIMGAKKPAKE